MNCCERREVVIGAFFDLVDAIITVRAPIRSAWTTHRWDSRPRRLPRRSPSCAAPKPPGKELVERRMMAVDREVEQPQELDAVAFLEGRDDFFADAVRRWYGGVQRG